ncbi:hypothetical protein IQ06DRAFT_342594 [Phaeosphaeriaceae sp. SRC1lsM3a]|nr:hypothetical protein IQ06DRAFT_342594 [Stagonospora sp. SRC1lsM3a]
MSNRKNQKRQSQIFDATENETSRPTNNSAQQIPTAAPVNTYLEAGLRRTKYTRKGIAPPTADRPSNDIQDPKLYDATAIAPKLSRTALIGDIEFQQSKRNEGKFPAQADAVEAIASSSRDTSSSAPFPQDTRQVKEDHIISLRLATAENDAETARLQQVLQNKQTELQKLKDRLRELVAGNKNDFSKSIKIVKRGVEEKRKEKRGAM